ncbi:hypothetical protein D3C78_1198910 [compost metagenome]
MRVEVHQRAGNDDACGHLGEVARIRGAGDQAVLALREFDPVARAVGIEAGHIQRAFVQQAEVGGAVGGVIGLAGHELVDAAGRAVVAHVERHAMGIVLHVGRVFVIETPHGRALGGHAQLVEGVDFHDPAVALFRLRRVQVVVSAFLAGQVGAPGGGAAGAVVQGADDGRPDRRCRRAADLVFGIARVALVVCGRLDRPLAAGIALDFDHRDADRGQGGLLFDFGGGRRVVAAAGEAQDLRIQAFVVDGQQAALVGVHSRDGEEVHAVVL